MRSQAAISVIAILLSGAAAQSQEYAPGFGPNPQFPQPEHAIVPTVNIAPAKSWPAGATPSAAEGMQVTAFAKDLDHPRWLYVLPSGDVLVAETDAPPRPEEGKVRLTGKLSKDLAPGCVTQGAAWNHVLGCCRACSTRHRFITANLIAIGRRYHSIGRANGSNLLRGRSGEGLRSMDGEPSRAHIGSHRVS
jgi:glucose/arabinose dehydrogenase